MRLLGTAPVKAELTVRDFGSQLLQLNFLSKVSVMRINPRTK